MNHIYTSAAILGIFTVWGEFSPAVSAQPPQMLIAQTSAKDFYNRGTDKLKRGDYRGAIEDFNQALRLNPKDATAYDSRGVALPAFSWGTEKQR